MSEPAPKRWTVEEFIAWEDAQEVKHEFVDGVVYMMTGARNRHEVIKSNLIASIGTRLRRGPCRVFGSDTKVVVSKKGNVRYPDVVVECGPLRPDDTVARKPRLVVEITSPGDRPATFQRRLEDYRTIASIEAIVVVAHDRARVEVYEREGGEWRETARVHAGLEDAAPLPPLGFNVALADIYEGLPPEALSA